MAKFSLIPFDKAGAPDIFLNAEINETKESLFLSFSLKGNLGSLDLEEGTPKKMRVMKLWEKTCFEFFIKNERDSYMEFNFSPCFEWNCFYFEKKGNPLKEYAPMERPKTDILNSMDHFLLMVEIKKDFFPEGFFAGATNLTNICAGITGVIKEKNGNLSYWALAHADTRPNFHHFDSFKYKF
jgi:hypothetical protein